MSAHSAGCAPSAGCRADWGWAPGRAGCGRGTAIAARCCTRWACRGRGNATGHPHCAAVTRKKSSRSHFGNVNFLHGKKNQKKKISAKSVSIQIRSHWQIVALKKNCTISQMRQEPSEGKSFVFQIDYHLIQKLEFSNPYSNQKSVCTYDWYKPKDIVRQCPHAHNQTKKPRFSYIFIF